MLFLAANRGWATKARRDKGIRQVCFLAESWMAKSLFEPRMGRIYTDGRKA
jgi:hypothetical protein